MDNLIFSNHAARLLIAKMYWRIWTVYINNQLINSTILNFDLSWIIDTMVVISLLLAFFGKFQDEPS